MWHYFKSCIYLCIKNLLIYNFHSKKDFAFFTIEKSPFFFKELNKLIFIYAFVEDRLTLILDNSITCELYVMLKVMYQLLVKYTVYRWVSLRSILAPLK